MQQQKIINLQDFLQELRNTLNNHLQQHSDYYRIQQSSDINSKIFTDTMVDYWDKKLQETQNDPQAYNFHIARARQMIYQSDRLQKQIEEVKKSTQECHNKVIGCQFVGTYDQYLQHLETECSFEFDENNVLRIVSFQKRFTEEQIQEFQYESDGDENQAKTLLVANFPQIGLVELFNKFGEIDKFHFETKNNLIFYLTYKQMQGQRLAMEQLNGLEIQGKKLRVTQFIEKSVLKQCRLFVKGLQTNDTNKIKEVLEAVLSQRNNKNIELTQASMLNIKSKQQDASAFIQFEEKDKEIAQALIRNKTILDCGKQKIGFKISFNEYRPKEENPRFQQQYQQSQRNMKSNSDSYHFSSL